MSISNRSVRDFVTLLVGAQVLAGAAAFLPGPVAVARTQTQTQAEAEARKQSRNQARTRTLIQTQTQTQRQVQAPTQTQAQRQTAYIPLAELLEKPVSIATVASLTSSAAEPAVHARLADALRDPRAAVRAVAARVAFVAASNGLLPAVRAALTAEQDPAAANEMIRALVTHGGSDALDDAWRAVDRLRTYALPALAESLARADRPELLTQLPRIVASGMTSRSLAMRVLELTAADPARRKEAIAPFLTLPLPAHELRSAMGRRNEPVPDDLARSFARLLYTSSSTRAGEKEEQQPAPPLPTARMAPPFVPGLWRDLSELYRCDLSRPVMLAANVRYTPDGRPREVTVGRDDGQGCAAATSVLASLSLFGEARPAPADYVEQLAVPWQPDVVSCVDQPEDWARSARVFVYPKPGTALPTKLREVAPVYPPSLRGNNEPASVLLDVLVSATGCARQLQVRRSASDVLFDSAAIAAAAQWRFSPAMVEEGPVSMWVGIQIGFSRRP